MDFRELEAFVALARNLHFAKAATVMQTSPSGLSRLLSRLEEELGVRLFERDTRRVELSAEGATFLVFATESLERRDELRHRLSASDGKLRGFLKVYASVTACYSVLPPFAAALFSSHPELHLSVDTGDPADAERMLRDGRAELVVAALSPESFTGLDCFSVQRTPLVFASSRLGAYGKIDLQNNDLAELPFILPKTGLARERFESWARAKNFKPLVAAEAAGNEAILALARLGLGIGLVPRLVLDSGPFAEGLSVYGADKALGDYEIGYVLRSEWSGAEEGKRLRSAIRQLLQKTYPQGQWREYTE